MLEAGGIGICCPELVDACVHIKLVGRPALKLKKDRWSWIDTQIRQVGERMSGKKDRWSWLEGHRGTVSWSDTEVAQTACSLATAEASQYSRLDSRYRMVWTNTGDTGKSSGPM